MCCLHLISCSRVRRHASAKETASPPAVCVAASSTQTPPRPRRKRPDPRTGGVGSQREAHRSPRPRRGRPATGSHKAAARGRPAKTIPSAREMVVAGHVTTSNGADSSPHGRIRWWPRRHPTVECLLPPTAAAHGVAPSDARRRSQRCSSWYDRGDERPAWQIYRARPYGLGLEGDQG